MKKINKDTNRRIVLFNLPPLSNDKWHQRNDVFSIIGIAPTRTATQHRDPPRILVRCK